MVAQGAARPQGHPAVEDGGGAGPQPGVEEPRGQGGAVVQPEAQVEGVVAGPDLRRGGAGRARPSMEQALGTLPMPVAFLRPAWFMENAAWDVAPARDRGVIPSFLQPLDKPVAMVATADVGREAAALLEQTWSGVRIVELEGPKRVTPNAIASAFAKILGRDVRAEAVPRDSWETLFRSQGMNDPIPRIRMLDGFNEGWIDFERGEAAIKGTTELDVVLRGLVDAAG